jgi:tetrahydromethanopterin S-methyltransferase subunit G
MSLKEKTINEVESRIEKIERAIAKNGVGSSYLSKAERVQRDVNIGLALGGIAIIAGATAWALLSNDEE